MKVNKITISNILGLESYEIKPGQFTAITGANGQGKTSALDAIKAAVGGGHDATLLRNGATEGRIVLELDDGSSIVKRVTAAKS